MFRMLYYVVIRLNIRDYALIKSIFRYFFEVEDDDPYRDDPYLISAEKLLQVYRYIMKKIDKIDKESSDKHRTFPLQLHPFVDHWDTERMKAWYFWFDVKRIILKDEKSGKKKAVKKEKKKVVENQEQRLDKEIERDLLILQNVLKRLQKKVLERSEGRK